MGNRAAVQRYRERNRAKVLQLTAEWRDGNKDRIAQYTRTYHLKKKGFSTAAYAMALSLQKGACAICKTPFSEMAQKRVHADHCHVTNTPRGVLCHYCNIGLGVFKDSPRLLMAAGDYLANPTMKEITMLEPKVEDLKSAVEANTNAIRDLIAALGNGQHATPAQVAAVVKEAKPKAEKKQETAKPEVVDTPTTAEEVAAPEPKAENSAPAATYDDAAKAITALAKSKGRDAAMAVLSKFGAAKLPDVKPDDFAAVIAATVEAGA